MKTLHYEVFLFFLGWDESGHELEVNRWAAYYFRAKGKKRHCDDINQSKSASMISCDHQERDRIQKSCPSPNQAVGSQVNVQSLPQLYRLSAEGHEHFCKKELFEKKLSIMSLS